MTDSENPEELYEFQAKNLKKARNRTFLIIGAGGVLGIAVLAASAFGINAWHESTEHQKDGTVQLDNGKGKFELKPYDRNQNRGQFENHQDDDH